MSVLSVCDPRSPSRKGGDLQIFRPCLLWPNGWMDQEITWHGGRPQFRQLCVRWGPSFLHKKAAEPHPQFSAHFYCGQKAGYIKMPLGTEVDLSPGDIVRWRPSPRPQKGEHRIFGPCLLRPNGCMDQDATWYGSRPRPRQHCVR